MLNDLKCNRSLELRILYFQFCLLGGKPEDHDNNDVSFDEYFIRGQVNLVDCSYFLLDIWYAS